MLVSAAECWVICVQVCHHVYWGLSSEESLWRLEVVCTVLMEADIRLLLLFFSDDVSISAAKCRV